MNTQQLVILPVQPKGFIEIAPGGLVAVDAITMFKLEIEDDHVKRISINVLNETTTDYKVDEKTREATPVKELVWIPVHPAYTEEVTAICQMLRMRPPSNQPPIIQANNIPIQ